MSLFDADTPRLSDAEFWRQYHEYVNPKNLYWKRKCQAVKRRAHSICERCHKRPLAHVHHLTYERFKHEPLEDLIGLCLACHQAEHPHRDLSARRPRTVSSVSRNRFAHDSTEWVKTGRAVTIYDCSFCGEHIKIGQPALRCLALDQRLHEACWNARENALRKAHLP